MRAPRTQPVHRAIPLSTFRQTGRRPPRARQRGLASRPRGSTNRPNTTAAAGALKCRPSSFMRRCVSTQPIDGCRGRQDVRASRERRRGRRGRFARLARRRRKRKKTRRGCRIESGHARERARARADHHEDPPRGRERKDRRGRVHPRYASDIRGCRALRPPFCPATGKCARVCSTAVCSPVYGYGCGYIWCFAQQ